MNCTFRTATNKKGIGAQAAVILLTGILWLCSMTLFAQSGLVVLRADSLTKYERGFSLSKANWRFKAGDVSNGASPRIPDSTWQLIKTDFDQKQPPKTWKGIGWFRLWIRAEDRLLRKNLAFSINQNGISEIFIDGEKVGGFGTRKTLRAVGKPGRAPFMVMPFAIMDSKPHLLAVHYSNYKPFFPEFTGFLLWAGTYERMADRVLHMMTINSFLLLSIGAQLALVFLHLLFFFLYPRQRLNLYYSLFVLFAAVTLFLRYINVGTSDPSLWHLTSYLFEASIITVIFFAGVLLYGVSYDVLPMKRIWLIAAGGAALIAFYFLTPGSLNSQMASTLENLYFLLVIADSFRAFICAVMRKKRRIWLIGAGMLVVTLFYFLVGSDLLGLMNGNYLLIAQWMSIGLLAIPLSFSIYLALEFADTNRTLRLKLTEVQQLSMHNRAQEAEKRTILTEQAIKLEQTVEERTREVRSQAEKLKEMDQLKSRFTVNLTHEFRTPLSLIMGPAELIESSAATDDVRRHAIIIKNNAQKLLLLTNQLLDLSRLEEGKMEVALSNTNLCKLVNDLIDSFAPVAFQKEISLLFEPEMDELWSFVDWQKLEMIIGNLLSNALKFSLPTGVVTVIVKPGIKNGNNTLEITVADTGQGIPSSKLPFVFDRFYQVDASDTRASEGSGIGLALTRELVLLLGGSIKIDSAENTGTKVSLSLPVSEFNAINKAEGTLLGKGESISFEDKIIMEAGSNADAMVVLVIEDNRELQEFIVSSLSKHFQMLTADNGKEGLQLAVLNIPDLVITDLMMPGMDGYEVCSAIKHEELTSHIPVMMLTAKSATASKTKGWQAGTDAYLTKPFSMEELVALANNLMSTRKQLIERYKHEGRDANVLPQQEQLLVGKVNNLIKEHMADELFGVEMLSDLAGMSRTQLHRKLKACIGQSPGDLIRVTRLQQSLVLLQNGGSNVSQVGYLVGFASPANFSTSFSAHFGYAPSEALNRSSRRN